MESRLENRRLSIRKSCLEGGLACVMKDGVGFEERGGGGLGEGCGSGRNPGVKLTVNTFVGIGHAVTSGVTRTMCS